MPGKAQTRPR